MNFLPLLIPALIEAVDNGIGLLQWTKDYMFQQEKSVKNIWYFYSYKFNMNEKKNSEPVSKIESKFAEMINLIESKTIQSIASKYHTDLVTNLYYIVNVINSNQPFESKEILLYSVGFSYDHESRFMTFYSFVFKPYIKKNKIEYTVERTFNHYQPLHLIDQFENVESFIISDLIDIRDGKIKTINEFRMIPGDKFPKENVIVRAMSSLLAPQCNGLKKFQDLFLPNMKTVCLEAVNNPVYNPEHEYSLDLLEHHFNEAIIRRTKRDNLVKECEQKFGKP
ncbi:hypothetical protein TRFO_14562 [Tritrichomonas foetus]|uniref:Uncharacterized protein n=1 Tax=Tritrichomonas foetus TaxID=1144522 RepID=A0A1J4KUT0_9EUKA|nr:hypothetical protein TRFO_14562 [Tritrichomonas foetus]|eukprot:OHT15043.1 hypothetical protein TRFO_14562 [Tritrichomonas foetus]